MSEYESEVEHALGLSWSPSVACSAVLLSLHNTALYVDQLPIVIVLPAITTQFSHLAQPPSHHLRLASIVMATLGSEFFQMDYSHIPSATPPYSSSYTPSSPFESYDIPGHSSPHIPGTPSYNGSYQNSPYSGHSELSYDPGESSGNLPSLFVDSSYEGPGGAASYDPSEYDRSAGLLMLGSDFMNNMHQDSQISLTVVAPESDVSSPPAFDFSSSSSNGAPGGSGHHSRASSVSSNPHLPAAAVIPSPRMGVMNDFANLSVADTSPHWTTSKLPNDGAGTSYGNKAQSPPILVIPGSPAASSNHHQSPPIINAPAGDGGMSSGPQVQIVPATPVSGGGGISHGAPYRRTLEALPQEYPFGDMTSGSVTQHNQSGSSSWIPPASASGLPDQSASRSRGSYAGSGTQHLDFPFAQHSRSTDLSILGPGLSTSAHLSTSGLLAPSQLRSRSKSDTSLQPPQWDPDFINNQLDQNRSESALLHNNNYNTNSSNNGTVNLKDIISDPSQPPIHQPQPPPLTHNFTFPPAHPSLDANQFLSPDISAANLRRSKSDSAGRPLHRRQSRSEDMSARTATMSNGHLFPPTSQHDFMSQQYLHPGGANGVMPIRGHTRRASSGSRHDRSISGGSSNWSGSTRPSPYPSPSASPRFMDRDLPALHPPPKAEDIASVMKPQVTTGRTELASHQRRTHPANFVCPVAGCGSTFTRSFNLKGHLRSHNEEKPFVCKWPGCGKGFARQHDCKRHELLHSNYRPFTCDGCQKTFARMDALNRHLKSDGGAECAKVRTSGENGVNDLGSGQLSDPTGAVQSLLTMPKTEDSSWSGLTM